MMTVYRILATYPCTSVMLLVRGRDFEHAQQRAAWHQKGAISYQFRGVVLDAHEAAAAM